MGMGTTITCGIRGHLLPIRNTGSANPNYKNGNRMVGWNNCPQCKAPLLREARHSHRVCRPCYLDSRKKSVKEQIEMRKSYIENAKEKRISLKEEIIIMYGARCQSCLLTYESCVYDFHHIDILKKEKNPSYLFRQNNIEKIYEELKNCALLCSNCHRSVHWSTLQLDIENIRIELVNIWSNRSRLSHS